MNTMFELLLLLLPYVLGSCPPLPEVLHGDWYCLWNSPSCHLECLPGFAPSGRTSIRCKDDSWSTDPASMTCPTALALVTGGSVPDGENSLSVEIYSTREECRRDLPNLPSPERLFHTTSFVDGNIILCGGWFSGTECQQLAADNTWVHHSNLQRDRSEHSSAVTMGMLTLLGGHVTQEIARSTEYLIPSVSQNWTFGFNLLDGEFAVDSCAVKISTDSLVLTGGHQNPKHVTQYNVTDGTGRRLQNLLEPRYYHGCTLVHEAEPQFAGILVAGGYLGSALATSELLDLSNGQWNKVGNLNTPRTGLQLTVLQEVLALGGWNGVYSSKEITSSVEQFNLTGLSWSYGPDLHQGRYYHSVTPVPQTMFPCSHT